MTELRGDVLAVARESLPHTISQHLLLIEERHAHLTPKSRSLIRVIGGRHRPPENGFSQHPLAALPTGLAVASSCQVVELGPPSCVTLRSARDPLLNVLDQL